MAKPSLLNDIHALLSQDDIIRIKNIIEFSSKSKTVYRDWFGINFSKNKLESIKFYFTFYEIPLFEEVIKLCLCDMSLWAQHKKNLGFIYNDTLKNYWEFGSGMTISIKCKSRDDYSAGFYYQIIPPNINIDTLPFSMPISAFDKPIGEFVMHNNQDPDLIQKYYYYANPDALLNKVHNESLRKILQLSQKVEIALGEGAINNANTNDIKLIMLGNDDQVRSFYLSNMCPIEYRKNIKTFCDMHALNIYSPGFYLDKSLQSCYFFSKNSSNPHLMKSIDNILYF